MLSEVAVGAIVRAALGRRATAGLCEAAWLATGGNPLYLVELLRAVDLDDRPLAGLDPAEVLAGGRDAIGRRVLARVRASDPHALALAQALATLGDGCELRHAAAIAGVNDRGGDACSRFERPFKRTSPTLDAERVHHHMPAAAGADRSTDAEVQPSPLRWPRTPR